MLDFLRQTAFDRPTNVYIQNNTDKQFNLFKIDLQSGVLMQKPPDVIKAGQIGYFKGDQTGLVGSSGFITYKTQIGSLITYISFYWSHPEGATSSIYYGYSSPFGVFYITPKNKLDSSQKAKNQMQKVKDWTTDEYINKSVLTLNPTGHYQSVTYLVQYSL